MKIKSKGFRAARDRSKGFSTLEVLLVMVVSLIIAAFAIPGFNQVRRSLRISGDGRDLNGAINQAKLQAAADFTRARVFATLPPPPGVQTFHVEVWNKALNGGNGCWQTVGDVNGVGNPRCTVPGTSPVQPLSQGVSFGLGGVGAPPPNTQAAIGQAGPCENFLGGGGTIANTACIVFNSRGMPVVVPGTTTGTGAGFLTPTGNNALYVTDNTVVYGVTVGQTGLSQVWATSAGGGANWYHK